MFLATHQMLHISVKILCVVPPPNRTLLLKLMGMGLQQILKPISYIEASREFSRNVMQISSTSKNSSTSLTLKWQLVLFVMLETN
jgi:hypothetical protein